MFNRTGSATHVLMDGATACMTNRQASFSFQERFGLHIFEYSYGRERERERERKREGERERERDNRNDLSEAG